MRRGGAEAASQRNGGCDLSHRNPPSAAPGACRPPVFRSVAGRLRANSAPALAVQNAHRLTLFRR